MGKLEKMSFAELAAALRSRNEWIIQRWEQSVRRLLPDAEGLTLKQILDSLPELLEQMAAALESPAPDPMWQFLSASTLHGEVRYHQHFNLNEVMIEYHLLRRTVLEQVSGHLGRSLQLPEVLAVDLAVDSAQRRAAVAFAAHLASQLKAGAEAQAKYLSFLSHDLRGGLNSVLLMVEVLSRELAGEPKLAASLEDLDLMKRSILGTVSTMDRFLQAEKLRKGMVKVAPARIDLDQFADELLHQFARRAAEKGIELRRQVPGDCWTETDRELLSLIVQNLFSNAIKFSSGGTVTLQAGRYDGVDTGAALRISVIDQGPGIPPEVLQQLFVPFTRGETYGQEGSGLGLSIAKHAADTLGAKLWAESTVGEGSAFHLELP